MLTSIESVPFSATDYAISVAEMPTANKQLNSLLNENDRIKLTDYLAFEPDIGETVVIGTGIRKFDFEYHQGHDVLSVYYFFHDLNMPLFIIGVSSQTGNAEITTREREIMIQMSKELISEHLASQDNRHKKNQESA